MGKDILLLYCGSSGDIAARCRKPGTWRIRPGRRVLRTWKLGRRHARARRRPTRRLRCRAGNSRRTGGGLAIRAKLRGCAGWAFAFYIFLGIRVMRRLGVGLVVVRETSSKKIVARDDVLGQEGRRTILFQLLTDLEHFLPL